MSNFLFFNLRAERSRRPTFIVVPSIMPLNQRLEKAFSMSEPIAFIGSKGCRVSSVFARENECVELPRIGDSAMYLAYQAPERSLCTSVAAVWSGQRPIAAARVRLRVLLHRPVG